MADGHPTDALLWIASVVLTLFMLYAFRGAVHLRGLLRGRRGYSLTSAMAVVIGAVFVSQVLSLVNASLILYDRNGTLDARVWMFLATEVIETAGVLYGFRRIRQISRGEATGEDTIEPGDPPNPEE